MNVSIDFKFSIYIFSYANKIKYKLNNLFIQNDITRQSRDIKNELSKNNANRWIRIFIYCMCTCIQWKFNKSQLFQHGRGDM